MTINYEAKSIIITKEEAKKANKINTVVFNELMKYRNAFPQFEIVVKATQKSKRRTNENKGLDYKFMESYILAHDIDGTIMAKFVEVKNEAIALSMVKETTPFIIVRDWFLAQFDTFADMRKKFLEELNETKTATANN